MSTLDVATKLVDYCRKGQNAQAIEALYAENIISREPCKMDEMPQTMEGIDAIRDKTKWFFESTEIHSSETLGPYMSDDDRFTVFFRMELTHKATGQRMTIEEIGLYEVKNGKVVREDFFYTMPG